MSVYLTDFVLVLFSSDHYGNVIFVDIFAALLISIVLPSVGA